MRCDGRLFRAHRVVIGATSEPLAERLRTQRGRIELVGPSAEAVQAVFEWLYCGETALHDDAALLATLEAAVQLQIAPLVAEAATGGGSCGHGLFERMDKVWLGLG